MQRYSHQLSIGGHPGEMEPKPNAKSTPKKEKPKSAKGDKKTDEPEIIQKNGNVDATKNEEHVYVLVKNGRKQWPLSEEDENDYLANFNEVCPKTKKLYLEFFKEADVDNDGTVEARHFLRAITKRGYNLSVAKVEKIFTDLNVNNDLELTVDEYMTEMCKTDTRKFGEKEMKELFQTIDVDKSGFISEEDLTTAMEMHQVKFHPPRVKEMIRSADKNHDGKISYDEFLRSFKRHYENRFAKS